ncbi:MAG TPA: ABC transporter substrate-binding protein [Acidimicrobiales bacterium]
MVRGTRFVAPLLTLALVAAACSSDRTSDGSGGVADPTAVNEAGLPTTFGTIEWPCRPSEATADDDAVRGVSGDTITIGVGDDRGLASNPGLNKELTDAVLAMVDRCNELGGIAGRTVEAEVYDAAIFNIAAVMTEACGEVFMLVGQGFALDDQGEEIRLDCDLASVPGFTVSAAAAHAPLMRQSAPNPADQHNVVQGVQLAELFPDAIDRTANVVGNFGAATQTGDKVQAAFETVGFEFTTELLYNILGEEDWTPFILDLKRQDIEAVHFVGSCDGYQQLRQAGVNNGYEAVWFTQPNFYSDVCTELNTDGALDGTYIFMSYTPVEEADVNDAVADFAEVLAAAGVEPSLLGMQASASFLLWATAADRCGRDLTTQCVLDEIDRIDEWTAGGLHAPTTPRNNETSSCGVLLVIDGQAFERVLPTERGSFQCDDDYRVAIDTDAARAARLDENRISTLYSIDTSA